MKNTVTAGIGGINFHLEVAAYERFKSYLDSISRSLSATEGREEILQDIEARVAELLQEKLSHGLQVVTLNDIEQVIKAIGQPEDFNDESIRDSSSDQPLPVSRKLFRDPDDKILGGVCSGIAAFLSIDALWLRLFFALLFFGFGTGLLLYIILWVVIPKAVSTSDKLRMRGEPVNLSTIERNIREEMEQVKRRAQEMAASGRKNSESYFRRFIGGIVEVVGYFLKAVVKVLAFFFFVFGLFACFALLAGLLAAVFHVPGVDLPQAIVSLFNEDNWFVWVWLGLTLALGIPFLALAWAGAKLLFNIRMPRAAGYILLGLWVSGVLLTAYVGIRTAGQFREESSVRSSEILPVNGSATLVVSATEDKSLDKEYSEDKGDSDEDWDFRSVDGRMHRNSVRMDITASPDDQFHLIRLNYARGEDAAAAAETAAGIVYSFSRNDSVLSLDHFLSVPADAPFRNQRVQLVLQVPMGRNIYLDPSMKKIIYDVSNIGNIYDRDMVGRTWQMTGEGLRCVDCDGTESSIGSDTDEAKGDIRIDQNGISIRGEKGERITVDSNGVHLTDM
ncbi:MAG: hypothetical protein RL021_1226 [Bacteroidota bacterium]